MIDKIPVRKSTAALVGLLALFIPCAVFRLDGLLFLEPDSPDYVIMSKSLVDSGVYRAPYDPRGILFSWRPPGLSLALIPASLTGGIDVRHCELMVLIQTLAMLLVAYRLTRETEQPTAGLVVVALLATNPNTLLWGTEVVTEPLYALLTLLILSLLGAREKLTWAHALVAYALLAALPSIRTAGLALCGSAVLWLSLRRRTRLAGLAMLSSVVPYVAWVVSRRSREHESYFDLVTGILGHEGPSAISGRMMSSAVANLGYLLRNLVPGGLPGVPSTSHVSRFPSTLPYNLHYGALPLACGLLALCCLGLWARRRESGGLALLYVIAYIAGVSIWPSRGERFWWPLLVVLLVFLPTGWRSFSDRLYFRSARLARAAAATSPVLIGAILTWQAIVSVGMAASSYEWRRAAAPAEGAAFPGYFADWDRAGDWLANNSRPFDRVLTARTGLYLSSHRFQQSILLGPADIGDKVRALPARYIALQQGPFSSQISTYMETGDWVYEFKPVYCERGVSIFEVEPNRSGTITGTLPDRRQVIGLATEQFRRAPWRFDLLAARADLLEMTGRLDEALQERLALAKAGRADLGVYLSLTWAAVRSGRYEEAVGYAIRAGSQPESEFSQQLSAVWQLADEVASGIYSSDAQIANECSYSLWLATQRRLDPKQA